VGVGGRLAALAFGGLAGLQAASQYVGWAFRWPEVFGTALRVSADLAIYPPWSVLTWRASYGAEEPRTFAAANIFLLAGVLAGLLVGQAFSSELNKVRRVRGWGGREEARRAGLLDRVGCVIGDLDGRLVTTTDMRPTLVTGGTRSGKGRGHVVPSLLSWTESVLVHDPKGELWRTTAGWRSRFSHALRFNPRDLRSARFNPLAEIRPGPHELAEVQRLVAILSDPGGNRDDEAIWDRAGSEILEAVILHVLYTADDQDKTLVKVRELLADLDRSAEIMARTLHRPGPGGEPETHPFIRTAVRGYAVVGEDELVGVG